MKSKENEKKGPRSAGFNAGWPAKPVRLKEFFEKNPTLWAVAWAILWRMWVIGFTIYFSVVVIVTILIGFARGMAFLIS